MPTFLADVAAGTGFNFADIIDTLFTGIEKIIGLFGKWPLNLYLGCSLLMLAVGLFRGLKKSA